MPGSVAGHRSNPVRSICQRVSSTHQVGARRAANKSSAAHTTAQVPPKKTAFQTIRSILRSVKLLAF